MPGLDENNLSCEEIFRLVNEILDGDLTPDKLEYAEKIMASNPRCSAVFHTLKKTVDLYRQRMDECKKTHSPTINWDQIQDKLANDDDNGSSPDEC